MYMSFLDSTMTYSCGVHTEEQKGDLKVWGGALPCCCNTSTAQGLPMMTVPLACQDLVYV